MGVVRHCQKRMALIYSPGLCKRIIDSEPRRAPLWRTLPRLLNRSALRSTGRPRCSVSGGTLVGSLLRSYLPIPRTTRAIRSLMLCTTSMLHRGVSMLCCQLAYFRLAARNSSLARNIGSICLILKSQFRLQLDMKHQDQSWHHLNSIRESKIQTFVPLISRRLEISCLFLQKRRQLTLEFIIEFIFSPPWTKSSRPYPFSCSPFGKTRTPTRTIQYSSNKSQSKPYYLVCL